jgi:hypothetical protein
VGLAVCGRGSLVRGSNGVGLRCVGLGSTGVGLWPWVSGMWVLGPPAWVCGNGSPAWVFLGCLFGFIW